MFLAAAITATIVLFDNPAPVIGCTPDRDRPSGRAFVSVVDVNDSNAKRQRFDIDSCEGSGDVDFELDRGNLAADGSGRWLAGGRGRSLELILQRFDDRRAIRRLNFGRAWPRNVARHNGYVAERFGKLWVLDEAQFERTYDGWSKIFVVDARRGKLLGSWNIDSYVFEDQMWTFAGDAAWMMGTRRNGTDLVRIDARTLDRTITPFRFSRRDKCNRWRYLIGTSAAVYVFDVCHFVVNRINLATGKIAAVTRSNWPDRIKHGPDIIALPPTRSGTIWVDAGDNRIAELQLNTGRVGRIVTAKVMTGVSAIGYVDGRIVVSGWNEPDDVYRVAVVDPADGSSRTLLSLPQIHCCAPEPPMIYLDTGDATRNRLVGLTPFS